MSTALICLRRFTLDTPQIRQIVKSYNRQAL